MRSRLVPIQERGLILLLGAAVLITGILVLPGPGDTVPKLEPAAVTLTGVQILLPQFVASTPVNINDATVDDLVTLPGIGPALARRILDYRAEFGPFNSVEELEHVSGIGPATIKDILAEGVVVSSSP